MANAGPGAPIGRLRARRRYLQHDNGELDPKRHHAEAVLEESSASLPDFGTESFMKFTVDGKAIGSYKSSADTIVWIHIEHDSNCDQTSALTGGDSFTIRWLNDCYP